MKCHCWACGFKSGTGKGMLEGVMLVPQRPRLAVRTSLMFHGPASLRRGHKHPPPTAGGDFPRSLAGLQATPGAKPWPAVSQELRPH